MGTRNLTMVISKGEFKIAQYGQWDGYPEGQGSTVLSFLNECDIDLFRKKLDRCRFIENSERKQKEIENFLKKIGSKNGWLTSEQSEKYHKKYPFLTRDNGAGILYLIYNSEDDGLLWLNNSVDFASDSLFCEWAYLIDLDKNLLEIYRGFNTEPLEPKQRFSNMKGENDYQPIKMILSYSLYKLPTIDELVMDVNKILETVDGN